MKTKRISLDDYRHDYLSVVESHLLDHRREIDHFTPNLMSSALRTELTHAADPETWTVEVPESFMKAVCEAEERIIDTIEHSCDLGVGHGAVVGYGPEPGVICKDSTMTC